MSNMVIGTNIRAMQAHKTMRNAASGASQASKRMANGVRLNSAADDAAGLGISEIMRAQVFSLDQAVRNNQDSISLIQLADGALEGVNDALVRIRELLVMASNDTYRYDGGMDDRSIIQLEIEQLLNDIDQVARRTQFGNMPILDGSFSGLEKNPGYNADAALWNINYAANPFTATISGQDAFPFMLTNPGGEAAVNQIVADTISAWVAETNFTGPWNQFNVQAPLARALQNILSNPQVPAPIDARPLEINESAGFWFQNGANAGHGVNTNIGTVSSRLMGIEGLSVLNASGASLSHQIAAIDVALSFATSQRGALGSIQNRLEHTTKNLEVASENLSTAKSRIHDADMAKEMMNLTKNNILQQVGQAMLVQGNHAPNMVLELLQ